MTQQAPRGITILVAVILLLLGVVGTFLGLIPNVGGVPGATIGVAAYVASTLVMLVGVFFRGV
jgi:hypothetical protein